MSLSTKQKSYIIINKLTVVNKIPIQCFNLNGENGFYFIVVRMLKIYILWVELVYINQIVMQTLCKRNKVKKKHANSLY